jgi:hypothetical protein
VRAQLLHGAGAEGVARGDHHREVVLQQPVRHLGQVGGFAWGSRGSSREELGLMEGRGFISVVKCKTKHTLPIDLLKSHVPLILGLYRPL